MNASPRPLPRNSIVKVSGVSFRQDAVRTVVEGDELRVRHDLGNQHDPHACRVETMSGQVLGFVPAEQAPRLSHGHPGGVWRAHVVDVLRKETWGLRVRVEDLVREGIGDVGQDAPGLRHAGDGTVQTDNGSVAVVDPAPAEPEPEPRPKVFARSGRLLGELLSRENGRVVVLNRAGLEATYPESVVRIAA